MLRAKYRVDSLLGVGGMAAVYAVTHRNGHRLAIKILHQRLSFEADVRRRFRREGLLANRVDHPGVVRVLDDDVTEDGCAFLVMPLLRGETLRARWERGERRLPTRDVLIAASALLDVLAAAHLTQVIHRDVKPENIFITEDGELRVLDFGIARLLETTESMVATETGHALGTPAFMSPEQALGRSREVDAKTDIWSVGATMFTCLSGLYVHEAQTASELMVYAATRPARALVTVVPDIDAGVGCIVDRALALAQRERWDSARQMRDATAEAYTRLFGGPVPRVVEPPPRGPVLEQPPSQLHRVFDVHSQVTDRGLVLGVPSRPANLGTAATEAVSDERIPAENANLLAELSETNQGSTPLRPGRAKRAPRRTFQTLVAGGVLALVAAATAVGLQSRQPTPLASARVESVDAAVPGTKSAVNAHVATSRRAWRDASTERAREEARQAIGLDPTDAEGHLAYVIATPFWPDDEARSHFMKAQEGRDDLLPLEREYVEALAPAMTVPGDFRLAAARLEIVHKRAPDDLVVRVALADMWTRLGELERPRELLAGSAEAANPPGIVLARYGGVQGLRDELDDARATFSRCLDSYPHATSCSGMLATLELNEGRCADGERILRRQLSTSPSAAPLLNLAFALHASDARPEEVQSVLDKWARLSGGAASEWNAVRADIRVALIKGRLHEALDLYSKLGSMLEGVDDDTERFDYTAYRMVLEAELGLKDAAAATLAKYVSARHGFQRSVVGGDNVLYLEALATQFGVIPWLDWVAKRDQRLATHHDRDDLLDGRARLWLDTFAMPATTKNASADAIRRLPQYLPILHRSDRWFWHDGAIGRVLALNGQLDAALPYFERAAASCNALEEFVQYTRALIDFAGLLERQGNVIRACAVYGKVLSRWAPSSESVSALHAAARRQAICRPPK